jgi:hypothetical protein
MSLASGLRFEGIAGTEQGTTPYTAEMKVPGALGRNTAEFPLSLKTAVFDWLL